MTTTQLPVVLHSRGSAVMTFEELVAGARRLAAASKAPATIRAYRADWRDFTGWCDRHGLQALPADPDTVALYLTDLAAWAKASTIGRRLSAISQAHQTAELDSPTTSVRVRVTMAGIRRTIGTAQVGKDPVLMADLRKMVAKLGPSLNGTRDRALLLVGFAGAFRRSELVALNVEDVTDGQDGLTILLRRSKTDQEGAGRKVGIPYGSDPATCPVRAYRAWLDAAGISEGPIFRPVDRHGHVRAVRLGDRAVAEVVKKACLAAGLEGARYAGHSLRSGLATSAAQAGASERSIMAQTGHKSLPMVRRYIRDGSLFRENAAAMVGL
ncbi:tyrosine-type recombinase/integrase [Acidiferrimicrobium sp. IK]|uniref:site-specific integrase n=1 Tax=Acidiferrimicrobium sp. IK TaxID=2871700 RepID=UPI0021CB04AD|nr:site-specific integrase [Acidiferrimicrobium sp. IK]MCU4186609.1 tyrosine-type recombinase/integrase [Acidiferrimicrobium sp. IK]